MTEINSLNEAVDIFRKVSLALPAKQELVIHEGNRRAIAQCARWVFGSAHYDGDLNRGIMLRGPKGTGKTHLMRILAHILTPHGFRCVKCDDIVKEFNDSTKYTVKGSGGSESRTNGGDQVIQKYAAVPRICFDDLCDERQGKYFGEACNVMERILSERADLMSTTPLLTMFTTNVEPEAIEAKYGERVRDRMALMCRAFVVAPNPDPKAEPFRATAKVLDWRQPVEEPKPVNTEKSKAAADLIAQLAKEKNEAAKQRIQEEQEGKARYLAGFVGRARQMTATELMSAAKYEPYAEARTIARQEFDRRSPFTLAELEKQAQEVIDQRKQAS